MEVSAEMQPKALEILDPMLLNTTMDGTDINFHSANG